MSGKLLNEVEAMDVLDRTKEIVAAEFVRSCYSVGILNYQVAYFFVTVHAKNQMYAAYLSAARDMCKGKIAPSSDHLQYMGMLSCNFLAMHWAALGKTFVDSSVVTIAPTRLLEFFFTRGVRVQKVDEGMKATYLGREVTFPLLGGYPAPGRDQCATIASWFKDENIKILPNANIVLQLHKIWVSVITVNVTDNGKTKKIVLKDPSVVRASVGGVLPHAVHVVGGKASWSPDVVELFDQAFGTAQKTTFPGCSKYLDELVLVLQRRYQSHHFYEYFYNVLMYMAQVNKNSTGFVQYGTKVMKAFVVPPVEKVSKSVEVALDRIGPSFVSEVLTKSRQMRGSGDVKGDDMSKNVHISPCYPNAFSTANKGAAIVESIPEKLKIGYDRVVVIGTPPGHMCNVIDNSFGEKVRYYDIVEDTRKYRCSWQMQDMFTRVPGVLGSNLLISDAWQNDPSFANKLVTFIGHLAGRVFAVEGGKEISKDAGGPVRSVSRSKYKVMKTATYDFFVKMNLVFPKVKILDVNYVPEVLTRLCDLIGSFSMYSHSRPHNMEVYISNMHDIKRDMFQYEFRNVNRTNVRSAYKTLLLRCALGNFRRNLWLFGQEYGPTVKWHLNADTEPNLTPIQGKEEISFLEFEVTDQEVDLERRLAAEADVFLREFGGGGVVPIPPPKPSAPLAPVIDTLAEELTDDTNAMLADFAPPSLNEDETEIDTGSEDG